MKPIYKNIAIGMLLVVVVFLALLLWLFENPIFSESHARILPQDFIVGGIEHCHQDLRDQTDCYRTLAEQTNNTFDITAVLRAVDEYKIDQPLLMGCHTFLHFYGQRAATSIGNIGEALAHGTPACFAGYYHGVLEKYFLEHALVPGTPTQEFEKVLPDICVRDSFEVHEDYRQCLHGLGHALMFATNMELPGSLALCDLLRTQDEQEMCYSGVFMENSFSNTNPVHSSAYIKKDDPAYPCTILDTHYLPSCYQQQTGYLIGYYQSDWNKVLNFCSTIPTSYRERCFGGVGQQLVGSVQSFSSIAEKCTNGIKEIPYQKACLQGVSVALREAYPHSLEKAIDFCGSVSGDLQSTCVQNVIPVIKSRAPTKGALEEVCLHVTNPELQKQCRLAIE